MSIASEGRVIEVGWAGAGGDDITKSSLCRESVFWGCALNDPLIDGMIRYLDLNQS